MKNIRSVCVVIPTLNEESVIAATLRSVLDFPLCSHVVVVDDQSTDRTGEIVRSFREKDERVHFVERKEIKNFARSYLDGFEYGFDLGADAIVQMDADGSHLASDLPRLVETLEKYDCVIGSRYIAGGKITNWSLGRRLISRAGNLYTGFFLNLPIRDSTSGFVVWRTPALRRIISQYKDRDVKSNGYLFLIWLKYIAFRNNLRLGEVPIVFDERRGGRSKYKSRIMFEAAVQVLKMRFSK